MAKIIFEADDNRKGIVDKIFVINKQIIQKGDKIANIFTQNKVYEIKAPITGEVQSLIVYKNKVINSGDVLLVLVPFGPILDEQNDSSGQTHHTISFNSSEKYNVHNKPPIDIKKSETEIFREELIETLLACEVAGENPQNDFEDTVEFDLPEEKISQDSEPLFHQNSGTSGFLLKDKIESVIDNIPSESNIETLQKDLGELKDDLVIVKDDLATMIIQEEIIEDIENLERDLAFTAEMVGKNQVHNQLLDTMVHHMYPDIKEELNQESNEKEVILDDGNSETIYFNENLTVEKLDKTVPLTSPSLNKEKTIQDKEKEQEELTNNLDESINTVNYSKPQTIANSETLGETKKENSEDAKPKVDVEHLKMRGLVHSPASSHLKKHNAEDEKSTTHSDLWEHTKQESMPNLEADQVKLNQQAIIHAKEIMARKKNIAHGFIDVKVDVSELVSLLSIMREAYSQNDIELTLLPFYVKAVYDGLKKFPVLNASFISKDHTLLIKWFYNIAFSVDSDTAVKMPVLYNLKNASIKSIASKLTKLINKTINNELEEKDYKDASFSIINYGEYGITRGTFTIPEDNVAGIAMGIIFKKPVVVEKNDIAIRDIMVITLGYNEAVINITEASKFVHYVAYLLSNLGLLL